jgi:hypothetical protein
MVESSFWDYLNDFVFFVFLVKSFYNVKKRGDDREAEGNALLMRRMATPYRGFESLSLRNKKKTEPVKNKIGFCLLILIVIFFLFWLFKKIIVFYKVYKAKIFLFREVFFNFVRS